MVRTLVVVSGLIAAGASAPVVAADDPSEAVESWLKHPILSQEQALAEVQRFTEDRVPKMPDVTSIDEWEHFANRKRAETLENVIFRGKAAAWRDAKTRVEWLGTIEGGPGYHIKTLRYEALPGLWIPALLYEPDRLEGKVPVILNVNGHDRPFGKAATYKQIRCINLAKRGMLALNVEWLGMGQLNSSGYDHALMNAINLCGSSGIATHYLAMTRAIDILLAHEHADPTRVAVTGLSGGGWQTIFVSAFDTRVTLCVPVAGYSSFRTRVRNFADLGDPEQTPSDLATTTDYSVMTAMLAPRAALLTFNAKDDCCFRADHALAPLLEAAWPIYRRYGKGTSLRAHVNDLPGNHNYDMDNRQALYRMLGDQFYPDDRRFDPAEIPCDDELKSKEAVTLPLPADNADFHTLALDLSQNLPRNGSLPTDRAEADRWRRILRDRLREVARIYEYEAKATPASQGGNGESKDVHFWKLQMEDQWTVPAVEVVREESKEPVLLIADEGRKSAGKVTSELLNAGHRVLAFDPFYLGESHLDQHDYLFGLLVETVGSRPVGLQASQVAAISRWFQRQHGSKPITIVAIGPRASLAALVAAVVEEKAIGKLELRGSLGSLKEVIEQKIRYTKAPEYFCFGLLDACDIKQITALVAPRTVVFPEPSDRAKKELDGLNAWYKLLGGELVLPQ
ncbi:MAG TPA: acetylxylan esterase [Isosphaeraceae bacterium]|jgi:hypothetical protein|nr:acetylxylan esterase [Isosphaeraceae bacterium]